jgi:hypothetical protein
MGLWVDLMIHTRTRMREAIDVLAWSSLPDDSRACSACLAAMGIGLETHPLEMVTNGGSMGVTAGLAMLQLLTGVNFKEGVAATGAISLEGLVSWVSGYRKKLQAAARGGATVRAV